MIADDGDLGSLARMTIVIEAKSIEPSMIHTMHGPGQRITIDVENLRSIEVGGRIWDDMSERAYEIGIASRIANARMDCDDDARWWYWLILAIIAIGALGACYVFLWG